MAKTFKEFYENQPKPTPKKKDKTFIDYLKENPLEEAKVEEPKKEVINEEYFVDLDQRIVKLINENFWELIDEPKKGKDGLDAPIVEIVKDDNLIKWHYAGSDVYENLIDINSLKALDGKQVILRNNNNLLEWSYLNENNWNTLLDITTLKGKDGKDGKSGSKGKDGESAKQIELIKENDVLKWHYLNDNTFHELININELTGPQGKAGPKGMKGDKGENGKDGSEGKNGTSGEKGERGERGEQGEKGRDGERGIQGETGPEGQEGKQGPKGDIGPIGIQGIQGPKGDIGKNGDKGDQGPKGDKGNNGFAGPTGRDGKQGQKGDKGDKGDKGEKGDQGNQGRFVELRKEGDWIEWKYNDEEKWKTLFSTFNFAEKGVVSFSGPMGMQGPAGRDGVIGRDGEAGERILLREYLGKVQTKYESDIDWVDLYTIPGGEASNEITSSTQTTLTGILTGNGANVSSITDNSNDWNEAYSWGEVSHAPTGFPNRTDTAISLVGKIFTITGTNFEVFLDGNKFIKNTQSITISENIGTHFIYYNNVGVLTDSIIAWDLFTTIPIATIYYDGINTILQEERHSTTMNKATHDLLHNTVGTRYGKGLTGVFSDFTFSIEEGSIYDEDLKLTITPQTLARVFYKNGTSNFTFTSPQTQYFIRPDTDLRYNNGNAVAIASNGNFVAYWIFATNNIDYPIISVMGQRQDGTINNARNNNTYESLSLNGLAFPEFKILYRVILRNDATPFQEVQDLRNISNIPSGTYVATDHNVLTGLTNPSHPASAIYTDTTNFNNFLDSTDDTVQKVLDKVNQIEDSSMAYSKKIDFIGDYIYKGEAVPGSVTSAPVWRISRTYLDPNDGDVTVLWADGVSTFTKIWDNHITTINYS